jgi:hypothetical protein
MKFAAAIMMLLIATSTALQASPLTIAAREAAETVMQKFGREAASEGVEKLAVRLESLAVKYGDDALAAARKVGPRGVAAIESAGPQAALAAKILSREGDRALSLVDDASRLQLAAKYGDDATEALLRHQGVAKPLIETLQQPAAKALSVLDVQNGRRLAMLADSGELGRLGKTDELLNVVGSYGNRAMEFVWNNKGALTVTAGMTAFIADPESFLNGTRQLAQVIGENVIAPTVGAVAEHVAPHVNWTLVTLIMVATLGTYSLLKYYIRQRFAAR